MAFESEEKQTSSESYEKDAVDIDSVCEEINQAVIEGFVEREVLEGSSKSSQKEEAFREEDSVTSGPKEGVDADTSRKDPGTLVESHALSEKIVRVVREKIEQVLDQDLSESRRGDSGIIAERVHVECTRLFGREAFRRDLVRLLKKDMEAEVVSAVKKESLDALRRMVLELSNVLVAKTGRVLKCIKESLPGGGEEFEECFASSLKLPEAAKLSGGAKECGEKQHREELPVVAVNDDSKEEDTALLSVEPLHLRAGVETDSKKTGSSPGAFERIRERLWWDGKL